MPARNWIGAVGLLAAAVAAAIWYGQSAPEPPPIVFDAVDNALDGLITVHVSGEVVAPGLVEVKATARVADAVAASGGTTRDADLAAVNLAAPLRDGQQVVIPNTDEGVGGAAITADGQVRINSATAAELEQLPGVGPVLAARIAAHREEHGPFETAEDLLDVPGIGEGKLETLRDSVALP
ncbi:MAG: ComEA family DNA-binding protein [bacterium]|nr:ComEA family DNA-binding protein [bacterium]